VAYQRDHSSLRFSGPRGSPSERDCVVPQRFRRAVGVGRPAGPSRLRRGRARCPRLGQRELHRESLLGPHRLQPRREGLLRYGDEGRNVVRVRTDNSSTDSWWARVAASTATSGLSRRIPSTSPSRHECDHRGLGWQLCQARHRGARVQIALWGDQRRWPQPGSRRLLMTTWERVWANRLDQRVSTSSSVGRLTCNAILWPAGPSSAFLRTHS
jgi:hypothetical protein